MVMHLEHYTLFLQVVLNSDEVILPGLPREAESTNGVYEVCACSNGRLYLTPSTASCSGSSVCSWTIILHSPPYGNTGTTT